MSSRFLPKSLSIVLVTVVAAGLAGCGLGGNLVTPLTQSTASQTGSTSGTTGSGTTANVAPGYISGLARGGQQPEMLRLGFDVDLGLVVRVLGNLEVVHRDGRSEEHTSELQSPMYLVCR